MRTGFIDRDPFLHRIRFFGLEEFLILVPLALYLANVIICLLVLTVSNANLFLMFLTARYRGLSALAF